MRSLSPHPAGVSAAPRAAVGRLLLLLVTPPAHTENFWLCTESPAGGGSPLPSGVLQLQPLPPGPTNAAGALSSPPGWGLWQLRATRRLIWLRSPLTSLLFYRTLMRPSDSKQMGPAPLAAKRLLPAHNPGLDRGESPGHGRCQLPSCSRSLWGIRGGCRGVVRWCTPGCLHTLVQKAQSGCACAYPKGTPGGGCGALRVAHGLGDTAGEPCVSPVPLGEREKEGQRQLAVRHPLFHEDFSCSCGCSWCLNLGCQCG